MEKERKLFLREINRKIQNKEYGGAVELARANASGSTPGDTDWVNGRVFQAKSQLELAEESVVAAIKKDPSNYTYYRSLGEIIGALGEVEAAKRCLRGSRFDDYINQRYFAAELEAVTRGGATSHHDVVLYDEPAKPLREIVRPKDSVHRPEFQDVEIQAGAASVLVIENGKVWFDGHNLCVYDQHDKLVKNCTMGNAALIENVRHATKATRVDGGLAVVVARSSGNYFHWSTDVMPGFHLLSRIESEHGYPARILVSHQDRGFQRDSMRVAGVDLESVFCIGENTGCYFTADKLMVPVFRHKMARSMSAWAVDYFRSLLHQQVGGEELVSGRRIYISRRDVRSRGIVNEDEVMSYLEQFGFEDIALDGMSVNEQMELFQQSEYIVAPHGAGLTNIIYCQPGTTVFEFFGEFVQPCFRSLATLCELRYAHLSTVKQVSKEGTLEKSLNKHIVQREDQSVEIEHLVRMLGHLGLERRPVREAA